jgi:hypothetical protein
MIPSTKKWRKKNVVIFDLTRGRCVIVRIRTSCGSEWIVLTTWNLLITDWIVVKRLAIGPLGQLLSTDLMEDF